MGYPIQVSLEMPEELAEFRLPDSVQRQLQRLLDLQDSGQALTTDQRQEAEALVNVAEVLTLLRLRSERIGNQ